MHQHGPQIFENTNEKKDAAVSDWRKTCNFNLVAENMDSVKICQVRNLLFVLPVEQQVNKADPDRPFHSFTSYVVHEHRATDFEAPKLWKGSVGIWRLRGEGGTGWGGGRTHIYPNFQAQKNVDWRFWTPQKLIAKPGNCEIFGRGRDYRGMESVWHAAAKKEEVVASRGIMQSATTDRNVFPPLILHSDRARSCLIAGCRKKYFPFLKNRFGGQNSMGSINDFSRKNHFFLSPILSYVFHNLVNCFDTPFVNYSKLRMYCKPP